MNATPTGVTVRRGHVADLAELTALVEEYCRADGHAFTAATVEAGMRPLLVDDRHGVVLVADQGTGPDNRLGGYGVVTWSWSIEVGGAEAVLDELYVRDQGRGTGSALVAALTETCRRHGMRRIVLETERPNDRARTLYERHGFVVDDSIWMSRPLS